MLIKTVLELGQLVRQARKAQGLTQSELAGAAGTGLRFIVDLERGKPTCEANKAFRVTAMLGIKLEATMPKE